MTPRPTLPQRLRNPRLLVPLLVVVAVVLLAAFISARKPQATIRAAVVSRQNIFNSISTNGKVQPADNFEARAAAAGLVKRVLVKEGDHVKAGQLLVQLDDASARADAAKALARLRAAQANLEAVDTGGTKEEVMTTQAQLVKAHADVAAAQRNLDALERLEQRGSASPAEVEAARATLSTSQAQLTLLTNKLKSRYSRPEIVRVQAEAAEAQAAYDAAQQAVADDNVQAPREGVVYSLPVHAGTYVNPGDLLVQVANLREMEVKAYVDEPDIGRLAVGQPVQITWDAFPGQEWQGTISRVPSTVVALGTRTVGEVRCTVPNPDLKLIPNINVSVTIVTSAGKDVLAVPREAVRQEDGQKYVYEVLDNRLQRRDVQTGLSNLTHTEVLSGLQQGQVVALQAVNGSVLRNGEIVRLEQPE
jgi:HlyD family secretion protein